MTGTIRVAVVATGTDATMVQALEPMKANTTRAPLAVKPRQFAQEQPLQTAQPHQLEADVHQAVAEAITQPEPAYSAYETDDGVTVEPYIPHSGARPPRRSRLRARAADSERLRAVACRASGRAAAHAADGGASGCCTEVTGCPKNGTNRSRAMPAPCSSGWPPMWGWACVRSTSRASTRPSIRRPRMPPRAAPSRPDIPGISALPQLPRGRGGLDARGRQLPHKEHIEIPSFLRKHG